MVGLSREVAYINKKLKICKTKDYVLEDNLLSTWLMLYNKQIHHINLEIKYIQVFENKIIGVCVKDGHVFYNHNSLKSFKKYCRNNKFAEYYGRFVRTLPINERITPEIKIQRYRQYLGLI